MNNKQTQNNVLWGLAGLAVGLAGFLLVVRPRHLHWGATKREAWGYLIGDEFLPDAENSATHSININAPVEDVWPWLIQLGQDKAGFYSYTVLENLVGCDMHNANEIHAEWQSLKEGDTVMFHPNMPPVPVVRIKENSHLVLGAELDGANPVTWSFVLRDIGQGRTRLIVRLRGKAHKGIGKVADVFLMEPAHFVMERKMMLTIKSLAERSQLVKHAIVA